MLQKSFNRFFPVVFVSYYSNCAIMSKVRTKKKREKKDTKAKQMRSLAKVKKRRGDSEIA